MIDSWQVSWAGLLSRLQVTSPEQDGSVCIPDIFSFVQWEEVETRLPSSFMSVVCIHHSDE